MSNHESVFQMMMRRHTSRESDGIRLWVQVVHCCLMLFLGGFDTAQAQQTDASAFQIEERVSTAEPTERIPWPVGVGMPEQVAGWEDQLMRWYHEQAFFRARVDSLDLTTRTVWVQTGVATVIETVQLHVSTPEEDERVVRDSGFEQSLWSGRTATRATLEALVTSVLSQQSESGFLGAQISISDLSLGQDGLVVTLNLETGHLMRLDRLRLEGDPRTRPALVMSALGLRTGQSLANIQLDQLRTDVAGLGWHDAVFEPRFELTSDSTAAIVVPVAPLSPGQFDLVVGALPASGDAGASVIGSGHLELTNAFGRGRLLEARVNRLPGQASSALLSVESPAPRGWPLVIHFGLQGHQQDSTWNQTRLSSRVLFRIDRGTWLGATFAAERTRSGFSGGVFEGGQQLVPRSSMQLGGMTLRIQRLDHPRFPRQGFKVESILERGLRSSRTREISGIDTLSVRRSERRERLTMDLDVYLMSSERLGWAAGVDVAALRAGRPDVSELLFLGGASSLRGYDEHRFQGTTVGRAFIEGRWYVDRASWGFLFFDAGWVAVDADFEDGIPALIARTEGFHPGYGFGFVFSSAAGPISLSYALNPDESLRTGRIHLGLSFGL